MAEKIDALIRQKAGGKKRLRNSVHAMMSWPEKLGRAFRHDDELPGLIGKPVGVDELHRLSITSGHTKPS